MPGERANPPWYSSRASLPLPVECSTGPERDPLTVFAKVAASSRVCVYDLPGTLHPVRQPTSPKDAAADLDKLLTASGEASPYVLVGHSYGGPIIRLFASDHPSEVAGLVLVDGLSRTFRSG